MSELLILTEKPLSMEQAEGNIQVIPVTRRTLARYAGDDRVVAVAGSRAMAKDCAAMELPGLRLIQLTSAGYEGVPLEGFAARNVAVANAGGVYSVPIAETVIFGILQMAKRLRTNPNDRRFRLRRGYSQITELMDKQVLILGAGKIGTAVAERLCAFGMTVDGYDPYCERKWTYRWLFRTRTECMTQLHHYDYVISTLPDTPETRGVVDAALLDCMKRKAVVVNVGRMAAIDTKALYKALRSRQIGGAVLDMFEKIPNPLTNPFRRLKNVVVLPGVAAISREVDDRLAALMTENVLAAARGQEISHVVNGVK